MERLICESFERGSYRLPHHKWRLPVSKNTDYVEAGFFTPFIPVENVTSTPSPAL